MPLKDKEIGSVRGDLKKNVTFQIFATFEQHFPQLPVNQGSKTFHKTAADPVPGSMTPFKP